MSLKPQKKVYYCNHQKRLYLLSTLTLKGTGIDNILVILRENNLISEEIYTASKLITETINVSANLLDQEPIYSIHIQDGILNLMNIQLLKLKKIDEYFNN